MHGALATQCKQEAESCYSANESILFIVRVFMIRFSDDRFVAAMTTIIIFLPTASV